MAYQTIAQLAPEVIIKLENRTTDLTRAYQWLKEAILELTSSSELREEFDDLERTGPPFNLSYNVREYPFSSVITSPDYNDGTLNVRIWPTIGSQNTLKLRFISYQEADRFSNNLGQPSAWYRFADNIGFDMIPDKSYQIQARYQVQHPFDATQLQVSSVMLPIDWYDVVVLVAVQKGFIELNEYEKADAVYRTLHGDPKNPTKPGLIERRKKRYEREAWRQEKSLAPYVGRYSARVR